MYIISHGHIQKRFESYTQRTTSAIKAKSMTYICVHKYITHTHAHIPTFILTFMCTTFLHSCIHSNIYIYIISHVHIQKIFESYTQRITSAIKAKYMSTAFSIWDEMINGDLFPYDRCVCLCVCVCVCVCACVCAPSTYGRYSCLGVK